MQNQNKCELIGYYGGDKTHALAAWSSTFEELEIEIPSLVEDRVDVIFNYVAETKKKSCQQLLEFLAKNNHASPFEFSYLHFQTNEDIATHIQNLKHRIGISKNTESARYKELKEDKYYIPNDWTSVKLTEDVECSLGFDNNFVNIFGEIVPKGTGWNDVLTSYTQLGNKLYHHCIKDLEPVLGRKRAKESARYFKTYNSQVYTNMSFNFRSFVHFQQLRNSEHAQLEVRDLAQNMLDCVKSIPNSPFEYSLKAFNL